MINLKLYKLYKYKIIKLNYIIKPMKLCNNSYKII